MGVQAESYPDDDRSIWSGYAFGGGPDLVGAGGGGGSMSDYLGADDYFEGGWDDFDYGGGWGAVDDGTGLQVVQTGGSAGGGGGWDPWGGGGGGYDPGLDDFWAWFDSDPENDPYSVTVYGQAPGDLGFDPVTQDFLDYLDSDPALDFGLSDLPEQYGLPDLSALDFEYALAETCRVRPEWCGYLPASASRPRTGTSGASGSSGGSSGGSRPAGGGASSNPLDALLKQLGNLLRGLTGQNRPATATGTQAAGFLGGSMLVWVMVGGVAYLALRKG